MREQVPSTTPFKLLRESEVAEMLRCSVGKVKRLRLSGKLPYLGTRPVFIVESDVVAYVDRERKIEAAGMPGTPEFAAQEALDVQKRAREAWMKHRFRQRRKLASKLEAGG